MHRKDLLIKINNYSPDNSQEKIFRADFLSFIYANDKCFDRNLLEGHITGSAWIINETRDKALLTHHTKLDRWLQLGGHADGEPDIIKVSTKETVEESGLSSLKLFSTDIFDLDIHPIPEHKGIPKHLHYDVRFLFIAAEDENLIVSNESKNLAWIPFNKLQEYTHNNESILRMARKSTLLP